MVAAPWYLLCAIEWRGVLAGILEAASRAVLHAGFTTLSPADLVLPADPARGSVPVDAARRTPVWRKTLRRRPGVITGDQDGLRDGILFIGEKLAAGIYAAAAACPLAIVLSVALEKAASEAKWWLGASGLMLMALTMIMGCSPEGLLFGFRRAPLAFASGAAVPRGGGRSMVAGLARANRRCLTDCRGGGGRGRNLYEAHHVSILDERVSVRRFWRANREQTADVCLDHVRRDWEYGSNY